LPKVYLERNKKRQCSLELTHIFMTDHIFDVDLENCKNARICFQIA